MRGKAEPVNGRHDAAADLSESETLDNQQLLDHLRTRYEASECCTVVGGAALLAINPHKPLRARTMDSYVDTRLSSTVAPHAYALAEEAFQQVCEADAAVAVLLTGESGAGKSRQAQQLIDYWCWRADGGQPRPSGSASVAEEDDVPLCITPQGMGKAPSAQRVPERDAPAGRLQAGRFMSFMADQG